MSEATGELTYNAQCQQLVVGPIQIAPFPEDSEIATNPTETEAKTKITELPILDEEPPEVQDIDEEWSMEEFPPQTMAAQLQAPDDAINNVVDRVASHQILTAVFKQTNLESKDKLILGLRLGLPANTFDAYMPGQNDGEAYRAAQEALLGANPHRYIEDGFTLHAIGSYLDLSAEWVRQREKIALRKLRASIRILIDQIIKQ